MNSQNTDKRRGLLDIPKLKHTVICALIPIVLLIVIPSSFIFFMVNMGVSLLRNVIVLCFCLVWAALLLVSIIPVFIFYATLYEVRSRMRARRRYVIGDDRVEADRFEKRADMRISFFGNGCEPLSRPSSIEYLRYASKMSFKRHIVAKEEFIIKYSPAYLDNDVYSAIIESAIANVNAYVGYVPHRKKAARTGPEYQKIAVVLIYSDRVEESLWAKLEDRFAQGKGKYTDGLVVSPCIIDREKRLCIFDGVKEATFGYLDSKNRAVNMTKKYVFGGKTGRSADNDRLDCKMPNGKDAYEMGVWSLFFYIFGEQFFSDLHNKRVFKRLSDGQVLREGDKIYVRLGERGTVLSASEELDGDTAVISLSEPESWSFPKANKISLADIEKIKETVKKSECNSAYAVRFIKSKKKKRRNKK